MPPEVKITTTDFNYPNYSAYCLAKPLNIQPTHYYTKTREGYKMSNIEEEDFEIDLTKGTCHHQCYYEDGIVWIVNDDDSYYTESFKSREDLEAFITKLRNCANECWS